MSEDTAAATSTPGRTGRRPGAANSDLWSAVLLAIIGGIALVGLRGRTGDSWIFPRLLTYAMLLFAAMLLVKALVRAERIRVWASWRITAEVWIFIGGVAVYLLSLRRLGFWVASALTCFVLIYLLGPERTAKRAAVAAAVTAGTMVFLFVVFRQAFNVPLPRSTWFST